MTATLEAKLQELLIDAGETWLMGLRDPTRYVVEVACQIPLMTPAMKIIEAVAKHGGRELTAGEQLDLAAFVQGEITVFYGSARTVSCWCAGVRERQKKHVRPISEEEIVSIVEHCPCCAGKGRCVPAANGRCPTDP